MLDYTQREKKFLPVKLIDGETLFLCPPKKGLYTKLVSLEEKLNATEEVSELYDEVTNLTAAILSDNKAKTAITPERVDEIMDIEDMAYLIFEYSKFAQQLIKNPN
jgi:hypothetical protein